MRNRLSFGNILSPISGFFNNLKDDIKRRCRSNDDFGFKLSDKLTIALLIIALVFCTLSANGSSFAATGDHPTDSNIGGMDLSISSFANILAGAFNDNMSQSVANDKATAAYVKFIDDHSDISTVGNLLGYYAGNDTSDNASNVWTLGTDASSRMMTLRSVFGFYGKDSGGTGTSGGNNSKIAHYIMWGSFLNHIGIDEFRSATSVSDTFRMIIGYSTYVLFIMAYSASSIMESTVNFLQNTNIFTLGTDSLISWLSAINNNGKNDFITDITEALTTLKNSRLIVLGVLLVITVIATVIWKSLSYKGPQQKWRNFLYRLIVMFLGIPIMGIIYTEIVTWASLAAGGTSYNITDYIFQEFVDFNGWTAESGSNAFKVSGMPTVKVKYNSASQSFDVDSLDVNDFAYNINKEANGNKEEYKKVFTDSSKNIVNLRNIYGSDASQSLKSLLNGKDKGDATVTGTDSNAAAYKLARNLIIGYAKSDTVSPDTMNSFYWYDVNKIPGALVTDAGDSNKNAGINAPILEQIFGVEAANQRIWSYVQVPVSDWIYPVDRSSREVILHEGDGKSKVLTLTGAAYVSGSPSGSVSINGNAIMASTLNPTTSDDKGNRTVSTESIKATDGKYTKNNTNETYTYECTFDLSNGGMSPLGLYNYLHSKFNGETLTVYSPADTSNAGVSTMHYAVTLPYTGVPELIQVAFLISILFCIGIIGWVFGITLLFDALVQFFKAIPVMFKTMFGSVEGFIEGCLIAFGVAVEIVITVIIYAASVDIVDLLVKGVKAVVTAIIGVFKTADAETYAMMSGAMSTFIIIWGTLQLIKWRKAITISLKSIFTHIMNQVFGTQVAMPTGASSKLLQTALGVGVAGIVGKQMIDDGSLQGVVDDLSGTNIGTSISDKIKEGDYEGAKKDISDFVSGNYEGSRGASETEEAGLALTGDEGIDSAFGITGQTLTDRQAENLEAKHGEGIRTATEEFDAAKRSGDMDRFNAAQAKLQQKVSAREKDALAYRTDNYAKAKELGVADYGDYLRAQQDESSVHVAGADLPEEPMLNGDITRLSRDGQSAYDAARDGDAETLATMAGKYDENGMSQKDAEGLDELVANKATPEAVAAYIDEHAKANFGDDYAKVVGKINEVRENPQSGVSYGNTNGDIQDARTVTVTDLGECGFGVRDNNSGELTVLSAENGKMERITDPNRLVQAAMRTNDANALAGLSQVYNGNGLDSSQQADIEAKIKAGTSAQDIAGAISGYQYDNFSNDAQGVIAAMNAAAGRGNAAEYGDVMVRSAKGVDGSTDYSVNGGSMAGAVVSVDSGGAVSADYTKTLLPNPSATLTPEGLVAYNAAANNDTQVLKTMGTMYNELGVTTADQMGDIQQAMLSGKSHEEISAMIGAYQRQNFGADYKAVVARLNNACGRDGVMLVGNSTYSAYDTSDMPAQAGLTAPRVTQRTAASQVAPNSTGAMMPQGSVGYNMPQTENRSGFSDTGFINGIAGLTLLKRASDAVGGALGMGDEQDPRAGR